MKILYFTATGNCLYVARSIGGELFSIPQLIKDGIYDIRDEAVGIVCPIYCGNMPKMVHRFLERARIRADYFFFIYTYGLDSTVARAHAVEAAQKAGLRLDYVAEIKMVDNYLPGFKMEEQMRTVGEKKIEEQIEKARRDIKARRTERMYVSAQQKEAMKRIYETMEKPILADTAAQRYEVNDDCTKCGICVKVCPAGNIRLTDRIEFQNHCETCYACIQNCPRNAIHLPDEQSRVRFCNEHIAVSDIIKANNQEDKNESIDD